MVFSKIGNSLFYGLEGEKERSVLKTINDNKVFFIINELYLLTNRYNTVVISIDHLIKRCDYKVNKKMQNDFKYILNKLKELNFINFSEDIKSYSKIIEIETSNLNISSEFFVAEAEELKTIKSNSNDKREYINIIKIYYYLKARIHKNNDVRVNGGKSQTTFNTYKDIAEHTLISESNIKKYIDKLQEINLIKYDNLGYKYKADNKELKEECANIYALTKISIGDDWVKADLLEGMKQQKFYYESNNYIITKQGYKNNDRKLNGLYGSLIKKEKNNTITVKEQNKLNKLRLTKELDNKTIDELLKDK